MDGGGIEMKVAKFGGSSLADANQFMKVANIVQEDERRKFIVISAPGKRHDHDYKMTDLLNQLGTAYVKDEKYKSYYITIMDRFTTIINELKLDQSIVTEIEERLKSIMSLELPFDEHLDHFKALGEVISARILGAYLNSQGIESSYTCPNDAGIIVKEDGTGGLLCESS